MGIEATITYRGETVPFGLDAPQAASEALVRRAARDAVGPAATEQASAEAPDAARRFRVPVESEFFGDDFLEDPRLDEVGEGVRAARHLPREPRVIYRWKKKGGTTQGMLKMAFCQKLSGAAKHLGDADYLVWVAADHLRSEGYTAGQVEALLYHELLHIRVEEDEEGEITFGVRHHDVEFFFEEYRDYGAWKVELERAEHAMRQLGMGLA